MVPQTYEIVISTSTFLIVFSVGFVVIVHRRLGTVQGQMRDLIDILRRRNGHHA